MIKGYKSFLIVEKLKELQLLLEGNIEYSYLFKEKLFDIKSKSKLAEEIYDLADEWYDDKLLKNNFIERLDTLLKDWIRMYNKAVRENNLVFQDLLLIF